MVSGNFGTNTYHSGPIRIVTFANCLNNYANWPNSRPRLRQSATQDGFLRTHHDPSRARNSSELGRENLVVGSSGAHGDFSNTPIIMTTNLRD
jgi:hypothetical protein